MILLLAAFLFILKCMILYSYNVPGQRFYAELRRDMALSRATEKKILWAMSLVTLGGGSLLFMAGAWPIVGFLGLDLLLVWGAFRLYRRSHECDYESIAVNEQGTHIEQYCGKACRTLSYQPGFVRIVAQDEDYRMPIELSQHGRRCQIGRWLGPAERQALLRMLKKSL